MSGNSTTDHRYYKLGDCLRGGFEGSFELIEEAWMVLSERFYMSFPSEAGRVVDFYVRDKNEYGNYQYILVRCDEKATLEKTGYSDDKLMSMTKPVSDRSF